MHESDGKTDMKFKAVFLDMDGTFLDFQAAEKEAFYKTLKGSKIEPDEVRYQRYSSINDSLWKAFERGEIAKETIRSSRFTLLFQELGLDADGDAAEEFYERALGEGHALMPHAREVLQYLSERYALYVVTNGFKNVQKSRLRLADIERFMVKSFISEEVGFQKPQKEFFDVCFAEIVPALKPTEVLLIGDSLTSDILGAQNAGIASCWFNPDGIPNESGAEPDYEIRSLLELKELLR